MPDVVALTSVVSSGLVALGGIGATVWSGRQQRQHEKRLAYEGRAWERKSDALFSVIASARRLLDVLEGDERRRERLGVDVESILDDLRESGPIVEAYASEACRAALHDLATLLDAAERDLVAPFQVARIRRQKEEAIDAGDFEEAARLRHRERQVSRAAAEALNLDQQEAASRARRLIAAARDSVQGA
ncbi:hypothetical protein I601_3561 [Nocardioides dokdonensis FR1436]|uniref:UVR domain-containing protein n=1 Tax=Nocardioides dokdonensis FR1436 TaxID=1300347 RepID=A0A1A9GNQ9_9ACTN|nr:UvrB/UvrC motif-containing protein [Nocardioides dokdonensis]ANH39967.1 hypothetical protein I601_3561 [Nocardioides dokdonensis FR1436]